jgi:hypothetical protein
MSSLADDCTIIWRITLHDQSEIDDHAIDQSNDDATIDQSHNRPIVALMAKGLTFFRFFSNKGKHLCFVSLV